MDNYSIFNIIIKSGNLSASAVFPADSLWFSGHFPGNPVLPGIAQIQIIFDIIKNFFYNRSENLSIASVEKIKFRGIILPDEVLSVSINKTSHNNEFYFTITSEKKQASSGNITVRHSD